MREADLQAQVIEFAHLLGWRTMHVRPSIGGAGRHQTTTSLNGWPDLFMWHPGQARTMAVELKSEAGRATAEQLDVLRSLRAAGLEVHVWRPSDWPEIERALGRQEAHADAR